MTAYDMYLQQRLSVRTCLERCHLMQTGGILLLAVLVLFSVRIVHAESPAEARQKLLSMVTGDISRSLAVEEGASDISLPQMDQSIYTNNGYPSGALYAVGRSNNGALGVGLASDTNIPQLVSLNAFGGPISGGAEHTLITDSEGNLWITGLDTSSQYGDGPVHSTSATASQQAAFSGEIKSVAAGTGHTLVVADVDGTLQVFGAGEGTNGQLGDGRGVDTNWFMPAKISNVKKVAAFNNNSFAITEDGQLYAFGYNQSGSLGVGHGTQVDTPTEVISQGVVDVAPGQNFALVLKENGNVWGMGLNNFGQFGDGTTDSSTVPKLVIGDQDVKAIAAGTSFSIFLRSDGSVDAVGGNSYGQIGFGDTSVHLTPTKVIDGGVVRIAAGKDHALVLTEDGALLGVGNSGQGQLGMGDFVPRYTYDTIESSGIAQVYAFSDNTFYLTGSIVSLQIKGLSQVYEGGTANFDCYATWSDGKTSKVTAEAIWQEDSPHTQIALNSGILTVADNSAPASVTITANFFGLTVSKELSIIPSPTGYPLWGMGENSYSQLGLDTTVDQNMAQNITGSNIVAMAGGRDHTLYVREDGAVFSAGRNDYGQLGTFDTVPRTAPFQISFNGPAAAVGAGEYHSFVVLRDGSLWAMGRNDFGQLGDGSQFRRKSPVKIANAGVVEVDGGAYHSGFRTDDGEIWTMGRGLEGQLGNGSTAGSEYPIRVHSSGATRVISGQYHTLFQTDDSALWGFGDNTIGQLGLGGAIMIQLAKTMLISSGVEDVAVGDSHTLYVNSSGNLYGAGQNVYGQLGDGTQSPSTSFKLLDGYSDVTRTWAGGHFTLFQDNGSIYGIGDNSRGQFGDGTWTAPNTTPDLLSHHGSSEFGTGYAHVLFTHPPIPVVTTAQVSGVTATSALSGGTVIHQGDSTVSTRGVCWSSSADPTTSDTCSSNGSGTGSFVNNLSTLLANATYHIRGYATNSYGTGYGIDRSFTTDQPTVSFSSSGQISLENGGFLTITAELSARSAIDVTIPITLGGTALGGGVDYTLSDTSITIPAGSLTQSIIIILNNDGQLENNETITITMGTPTGGSAGSITVHTVSLMDTTLPTVLTSNVSGISSNIAQGGGNVTSEGSTSVTDRGLCWSTSATPNLSDPRTSSGTGGGSFTGNMTGLQSKTDYYVRAYATNSIGTAYGAAQQFTTIRFPWQLFLDWQLFREKTLKMNVQD